jgi:hypothetical protein
MENSRVRDEKQGAAEAPDPTMSCRMAFYGHDMTGSLQIFQLLL